GSTGAGPSPSPSSTQSHAAPSGKVAHSFTGVTATTTGSFSVSKGWELRFQINRGPITIDLVTPAGKEVAQLIKYKGPGGGSLFPQQVGKYALRVAAKATWRVQVVNH